MRIELLQFIRSNLKQQLAGVLESRKGFLEAQIVLETDQANGGFLGIGAKKQTTAIKLRPNSALLSRFEMLINRYEAEQEYGVEEMEKTLDYDQQIRALTQYVDQILEQEDKLESWLATVPSTHQPETYIIDMRFSNNIERIVRLIHAIESSSKWLQVRNLQVTIADKKETTISAKSLDDCKGSLKLNRGKETIRFYLKTQLSLGVGIMCFQQFRCYKYLTQNVA